MSRTNPRALQDSQSGTSSSLSNCLQGARARVDNFIQETRREVARDVRDGREILQEVAATVSNAVTRRPRPRVVFTSSTTAVHGSPIPATREPSSWGLLNQNADLRVSS